MVDEPAVIDYPIESIPEDALLYMRAHRQFYVGGELQPGVFRDQGKTVATRSMSADWDRYSTAAETRSRARIPADNAVLELQVRAILKIPTLLVNHRPLSGNRSHTDVLGEKSPEVRLKLLRLQRTVITLADSFQPEG